MYSYIKGIITEISPRGITIENNGIGYFIEVANPFSFNLNEEQQIHLSQIIREDSNTLFGFVTIEEKQMFLDLISVKGIGPKTALAMLAAGNSNQIKQAIIQEDVIFLQKFPKIGKKAASQIVLDLANKYDLSDVQKVDVKKPVINSTNDDVVEALVALGYKQAEIKKQLKIVSPELTTEAKIKQILTQMLKK